MTNLFVLIRKTKRAKLSTSFGSSNTWISWKSYATRNAWIRRLSLKQSLSSVDQQGELKCHPEPVKRTMQEEDTDGPLWPQNLNSLGTGQKHSNCIQQVQGEHPPATPGLFLYETSWFTLMMPHWHHKCAHYINFMQASTQCVETLFSLNGKWSVFV